MFCQQVKKINRNFPVNQQVSCCSEAAGLGELLWLTLSFCNLSVIVSIRGEAETGHSDGARTRSSHCSTGTIFASFKPAEEASEKQAARLAVINSACHVSARTWGGENHSGGVGGGGFSFLLPAPQRHPNSPDSFFNKCYAIR